MRATRGMRAHPGTANGPRAVLGSQPPPTRNDTQTDFTRVLQPNALRAEDGSRSVPLGRSPRVGAFRLETFSLNPETPAVHRQKLTLISVRLPDAALCSVRRNGAWSLRLGASLELGAWCLEL